MNETDKTRLRLYIPKNQMYMMPYLVATGNLSAYIKSILAHDADESIEVERFLDPDSPDYMPNRNPFHGGKVSVYIADDDTGRKITERIGQVVPEKYDSVSKYLTDLLIEDSKDVAKPLKKISQPDGEQKIYKIQFGDSGDYANGLMYEKLMRQANYSSYIRFLIRQDMSHYGYDVLGYDNTRPAEIALDLEKNKLNGSKTLSFYCRKQDTDVYEWLENKGWVNEWANDENAYELRSGRGVHSSSTSKSKSGEFYPRAFTVGYYVKKLIWNDLDNGEYFEIGNKSVDAIGAITELANRCDSLINELSKMKQEIFTLRTVINTGERMETMSDCRESSDYDWVMGLSEDEFIEAWTNDLLDFHGWDAGMQNSMAEKFGACMGRLL